MGSSTNFGTTLEQLLLPNIEVSRVLKELIFQQLRVAVPAIVQSFNPGPPATVTVTVATQERIQHSLPITGPLAPRTNSVTLPVLADVPVCVPSGGGFSFTLPIQPGDECLVVFSDSSLDSWFQSGGINNVAISQRRHHLSDAIAIFGLRSTPRALTDYSTDSAQLRSDDGTVVIDLAAGQV